MAESEHDESLVDDIMRGGPSYALKLVEELQAENARLLSELEATRKAKEENDERFQTDLEAALIETKAELIHNTETERFRQRGIARKWCDLPDEIKEDWRKKARALLQQTALSPPVK